MHWCSYDKDVLEISSPSDIAKQNLEKAQSHLASELHAKVIRKVSVNPNHQIIVYRHKFSSMQENVNAIIERFNCIEIQPTIYKEGAEWYRIVAFSNRDVRSLYAALSKFANVKTVSQDVQDDSSIKRSVFVSSSYLLSKLTEKQRKALRTAITLGYFDIPPRISTKSMAEKYGIARTTFEECVRKAEDKILKALLPYLEME